MIPMRRTSGAIAVLSILAAFILSSCLDSGNDLIPDEPLAVAEIAGDWTYSAQRFTDVATGEFFEFEIDSEFIDESLDITDEGRYELVSVQAIVDTAGMIIGDTTIFDSGIMGVQNDKMIVIPDDPQTSSLAFQQAFTFFLYSFNNNELEMSFFFEFPFDVNFDGTDETVTLSRIYR